MLGLQLSGYESMIPRVNRKVKWGRPFFNPDPGNFTAEP
jgi:hypothetical protein